MKSTKTLIMNKFVVLLYVMSFYTSVAYASNDYDYSERHKQLYEYEKSYEAKKHRRAVINKNDKNSNIKSSIKRKENTKRRKRSEYKEDTSRIGDTKTEKSNTKVTEITSHDVWPVDNDVYEIHPVEVETGDMVLPGLGLYLPAVEYNPFVELHIGDIGSALFNGGGMDYESKWYSFNALGEKDVLLTVRHIRGHFALGANEDYHFTVVDLNRHQTDPILISKKRKPRIVYFKGYNKYTVEIYYTHNSGHII